MLTYSKDDGLDDARAILLARQTSTSMCICYLAANIFRGCHNVFVAWDNKTRISSNFLAWRYQMLQYIRD